MSRFNGCLYGRAHIRFRCDAKVNPLAITPDIPMPFKGRDLAAGYQNKVRGNRIQIHLLTVIVVVGHCHKIEAERFSRVDNRFGR